MTSDPHILLMIESSRESGRQLISGIADYARHFGPWNFHWEPVGLARIASEWANMEFDGILVRDVADVSPLIERGIPTVTFTYSHQKIDGVGWVNTNDEELSKLVAEHFIQRGFSNFAFCGFAGTPWSQGRRDGFLTAVKDFFADSFWMTDDELKTITWLKNLPKPIALMAANDEVGLQVIRLCREAGLRVPDDCAVVGVDNDPVVCGLSYPPLSSVALQQYQSGYNAAALLDKMMRGQASESLTVSALPRELVVRQSSDVIADDDDAVSKALRFIQQNPLRTLYVDEVARVAGLHRRGLERRFDKYLGRSIQQVCREARADYLARILSESRLSLEEISEQCGFSQAAHMTRFFVSVRGETPSVYRKRISKL